MDIHYVNPGFEAMIESILSFQTEGESAFWSDSLFYFFPSLDKERCAALDFAGKRRYLTEELRRVYEAQEPLLCEKAAAYEAHWQTHRPQIEAAFADTFQLDCRPLFNNLRGEISLNPVSPRCLQKRRFEVFYLNSPQGALGVSLHELTHFVWFHVWQGLFHDGWEEYERPALPWIFSEMVVESILRDERLSSINPYFPREHGGCVYGYFQDMELEGKPALTTLEELYQCHDIRGFMREGYRYCKAHEDAIRAHIAEAEKRG